MKELIGNKKFKTIASRWLTTGRMPHAVIIEGEKGLGRHTAANWLAAALVCTDGQKPCGHCRDCHLFSVGTHPDIRYFTPGKANGIFRKEEIEELCQKALEAPDRDGRKIFIIDADGTFTVSLQNMLLKLIEEPPEFMIFIIITNTSSSLLETIISRCVCIELTPPSEEEALALLSEMLPDVGVGAIESALGFNGNNIGKTLLQLEGKTGEISADTEALIELISTKRAYEALRVLSKYEKKQKDFLVLLSLLEATAEIELRRTSLGQPSRLSANELMNLKNWVKKTLSWQKFYVNPSLLITTFCAGIFGE